MATVVQQQYNTYFKDSCRGYFLYPTNLVYRASYRKVLESHRARLDESAPALFFEDADTRIDVRFRDYDSSRKRFIDTQPKSICNLTELRRHLGDTVHSTTSQFNKKDPKCRYVLICSKANRQPLRITKSMTNLLLSFHQVMPSYLDFISVFGRQYDQCDIRSSAFHEQSTLAIPPGKRPAVPELDRSGYGYQICYNLKTVVDKKDQGIGRWSVRQAALHHQFDVKMGTALWICTEGRNMDGLFDRINDLTSDPKRVEDWSHETKEESFRSSLATHLSCCHWSIENWRSYISWLERTINAMTEPAVDGNRNNTSDTPRRVFKVDDIQLVQAYEDKVNEVVMILDANTENLHSLSGFYANLMDNDDFDVALKRDCVEDIREFGTLIAGMVHDARMQIRRAKLLAKLTADRKALILQLLQGQATEVTLGLSYMSYKEAIVMRIITIVTLIFLPATFASTFFSTDIVKYQDRDRDGSFSKVAMYRWLQVTLPLSALTLSIGYGWYRYKTTKSKKSKILPS